MQGELITDELSVDEVDVQQHLHPFEMEDLNDPRDEVEDCRANSRDVPLAVQTRKRAKRKSYNSEETDFNDSDSDDQRTYSLPAASSEDEDLHDCEDAEFTQVELTTKPVPGYRELDGDLSSCRQQKKKGYPYALAYCISADAAMAAGIAVIFCEHFEGLRRRLESEAHRRATLIAIYEEADQCWIYNLVTKDLCFEKP